MSRCRIFLCPPSVQATPSFPIVESSQRKIPSDWVDWDSGGKLGHGAHAGRDTETKCPCSPHKTDDVYARQKLLHYGSNDCKNKGKALMTERKISFLGSGPNSPVEWGDFPSFGAAATKEPMIYGTTQGRFQSLFLRFYVSLFLHFYIPQLAGLSNHHWPPDPLTGLTDPPASFPDPLASISDPLTGLQTLWLAS